MAAGELKVELARWQQIFADDAPTRVALWFKELSTLPPQARELWTMQARQLTEREVTHLVSVSRASENKLQQVLVLPLVAVEDRLLIVPSDKTNRESSAAGSRR